jgi:hypothetical protein
MRLGGGLGAVILASGIVGRELASRRRLRGLFETEQVGVEVLLRRDSVGRMTIYAGDDGTCRRPLATWSELSWSSRHANKRAQQVTLVGDLSIGGWVVVASERGVTIPDSPLRQPRWRPALRRLRRFAAVVRS